VSDYLQRPEFELYDLSVDPLETDNLIENPKAIEVIMMMKDKLKDFQERTNDPWITKWQHE
jgi:N-sulfoglucosamine sulfohydrolase